MRVLLISERKIAYYSVVSDQITDCSNQIKLKMTKKAELIEKRTQKGETFLLLFFLPILGVIWAILFCLAVLRKE